MLFVFVFGCLGSFGCRLLLVLAGSLAAVRVASGPAWAGSYLQVVRGLLYDGQTVQLVEILVGRDQGGHGLAGTLQELLELVQLVGAHLAVYFVDVDGDFVVLRLLLLELDLDRAQRVFVLFDLVLDLYAGQVGFEGRAVVVVGVAEVLSLLKGLDVVFVLGEEGEDLECLLGGEEGQRACGGKLFDGFYGLFFLCDLIDL